MDRRAFIGALTGCLAAPLAVDAQQFGKMPRVGVLWHAGSAEEEANYLGALRDGLTGLGYIDGRTIRLEHRFPNEQPERFVSQASLELGAKRFQILKEALPLVSRVAMM